LVHSVYSAAIEDGDFLILRRMRWEWVASVPSLTDDSKIGAAPAQATARLQTPIKLKCIRRHCLSAEPLNARRKRARKLKIFDDVRLQSDGLQGDVAMLG
jgi:hypothetical protein